MKPIIALTLFLFSPLALAATYELLPAQSKFTWTGSKPTGNHTGNIKISAGALTNNKNLTGKVTLDMNTIVCNDLTGEWKQKLEGHLKSDDFFNVKKFPNATFELSKNPAFSTKKSQNFTLNGKLTVKGITHPVKIPGKVTIADNTVKFSSAEFEIDRTKWDIKYNSKKFFDIKKLGDKMIHDAIKLKFDVTFQKSGPKRAKK